MATITHIVEIGDTLVALAEKYGTTVDAIARLNGINIENTNLIYIGQVLYISGKPSGPTSNVVKPSISTGCSIRAFGLQSNTTNVLFAIWDWDNSNTEKFQAEWDYYTNDGQWFVGSHTTIDYETSGNAENTFDSTYTVPENAISVRFRVKPISKTYQQDQATISYWTSVWSSYKTYNTVNLHPPKPSTPVVKIEGYTLTCSVGNLTELSTMVSDCHVEFQIIKDDAEQFYLGLSRVIYLAASYSCTIDPGHLYKVRARVRQGTVYGEWSDYSANVSSVPSAPAGITYCAAASQTSVMLKWDIVASAKTYSVEYTTDKELFEGSNGTTIIDNIETNQYIITGLEIGEKYYFRVRSANESGSSAWTPIVASALGTRPIAPTTWSSSNTAIVGEPLKLYWIHNSEDGSKETRAELILNIDGVPFESSIKNTSTEDGVTTTQYDLDTKSLIEGALIKWKVRTAGVTEEMGDWSVERTINVYAKPSLSVNLYDIEDEPITVLQSFPFYIKAQAGPSTQTPISFHVSIMANESYETVDEVGNFKMVIAGDAIYSQFYDINENLTIEMLPSIVDLQANISYSVTVTVAMDSGLTAETTTTFTVSWTDETMLPNAEIMFDKERMVAHIRPFCEYMPDLYYLVKYMNYRWVRTSTRIDPIEGISVDNAITTSGDIVYVGYDKNNVMTHFCVRRSFRGVPTPDVTLAVFRREFDGTFTEIGSGLANETNTFVTDPHPSLDYARYRVVVTSDKTGAVNYIDLPGYYIGEKSVILQWNETWGNYTMTDNGVIQETLWAGSMLRLPYNIDISEATETDATVVEYIGRTHPVSYYGTQVGSSATWSVAIPKHDTNTLTALRRLSMWMGDVYVREPSGSGYWAHITISFKQTHRELTIPVTINITRVSGGV